MPDSRPQALTVSGVAAKVTDSRFSHAGDCSANAWPRNCAIYGQSVRGLLYARNHATCLCQCYSFFDPSGLAVRGFLAHFSTGVTFFFSFSFFRATSLRVQEFWWGVSHVACRMYARAILCKI